MSRDKISKLMDAETWMDAHKAVELGFADGILQRADEQDEKEITVKDEMGGSMMFSRAAVTNSLMDKLAAKCRIEKAAGKALENAQAEVLKKPPDGRSVDELMERLELVRNHF